MVYKVVDLFSGGGGMSAGFHYHPKFKVVGAVDAQLGKPSSRAGSLGCNKTYESNMGFNPIDANLAEIDPVELRQRLGLEYGEIDVLSACPPCTGFSRANAKNHLIDDERNSLVTRVALFVEALGPQVVVMENARELLMGNFRQHFDELRRALESLGFEVKGEVRFLNDFGLPQVRERALIVAARGRLVPRSLEDLWEGFSVDPLSTTVRRAIGDLPPVEAGETYDLDAQHVSPRFGSSVVKDRTLAMAPDGGSWKDLVGEKDDLLTPAMRRSVEAGRLGSFPDVYGRMFWDRPAPTIKRECGHVGNGRYTHPAQDRLCTVREMAILNGFPSYYNFKGSISNRYRHIGDAVPPLISYQIAHAVEWAFTGERPSISSVLLKGTSLRPGDIIEKRIVGEEGAA